MKYVVGVSDMVLSTRAGDELVTHALGSCIGIAIHDAVAGIGGILHYMLPLAKVDPVKAAANPFMFGDTGIPLLFEKAYDLGARKERLRVVIAGGAQVFEKHDIFDIGKRNIVIARKLFWKNNILSPPNMSAAASPARCTSRSGRVRHGSRRMERGSSFDCLVIICQLKYFSFII
jgi:chemotaxis protein CheD